VQAIKQKDHQKFDFNNLILPPICEKDGSMNGHKFRARVLLPNYKKNVTRHYQSLGSKWLESDGFDDFGIKLSFEKPSEISIYDADFLLSPDIKNLISHFGVVLFENVYLSEKQRGEGQRNIFPSHAFHVDRGRHFDNQYSLFLRDPFDPVQKDPRRSSSLVISKPVARLQAEKEGKGEIDLDARHDLFVDEAVQSLSNTIILRQSWSAPAGTGELCVFDNRTVLHASYYKVGEVGYPIGVRYLF
jgi:hypothetical protein